MGMFDPTRLYAAEIAGLIPADEAVRYAATAQYFAGREDTGRPDPGVSFDPINGLDVPAWNAAMEGALGGVTLHGPQGSLAQGLVAAFRTANHLVVTDRRLLAMTLTSDRAELHWEAALSQLAELRWDPRFLQHGRVRLLFSDGSMARLVCGVVSPSAARRLAASVS